MNNTRNEEVERNIRTGETRKPWAAPEVTRLDFPKTANFNLKNQANDSLYNHS